MEKTLVELLEELARSEMKISNKPPVLDCAEATAFENDAIASEDDNATVCECNLSDMSSVAEMSFARGRLLLDTYRILSEPIGGGMGNVWRVHHQNWNVDLAMKRPKAQLFQSEIQKKNFIDECRAWINLGLHPNIVPCYYVREIEGVPTIFSEWMDNGSLEDRIRDKSLYAGSEKEQQERLLNIAIQFARGLHYAHEQGLIHQDVKPGNLLLSKGWDAGVADFGLAKARAQLTVFEDTNTVPDTGATAITPAGAYSIPYCSMEQMDGQLLTRRTDIYSWAVSVMEMYIGSHPWTNGIVAGMNCKKYMEDSQLNMPENLKKLLKKCMAAGQEDRPHSFAEVEEELHKIYKDETGRDYPRPVPGEDADTADSLNNRALSYMDIGLEEQAEICWRQAIEKEHDHKEAVYNLNLYLWRRGYINDNELERSCSLILRQKTSETRRLEKQLHTEMKEAAPLEFSNVQYYDKVSYLGSEYLKNNWCTLSRDGKRLYCLDLRGRLSCTTTASNQTIWQKENENAGIPRYLSLTAEDRYLIYYFDDRASVYVADAENGGTVCILTNSEFKIIDVCVHPDNDSLYAIGDVGILCKWSIRSCRLIYSIGFGAGEGRPYHICIRSDNHRVYVSCMHDICQFDGYTGRYMGTWRVNHSGAKLHLSPDGSKLYIETKEGAAFCDTESGDIVHPKECLQAVKSDMDKRERKSSKGSLSGRILYLTPDGKRLLRWNVNNCIELWDTEHWKRLRIFKRKNMYSVYSLTASMNASVIAVSCTASRDIVPNDCYKYRRLILVWNNDKNIYHAPWELSIPAAYAQKMEFRQKIEEEKSVIERCIRKNEISYAAWLLEYAEQRYAPYEFQPLRSKLQQVCKCDRLRDCVEIASIPIGYSADLPLEAPEITADTKGNLFAATGYGDPCMIIFDCSGQIKATIEHHGIKNPCFSHSGKLLAVAVNDGILVYDMEKMSLCASLGDALPDVIRVDFSPDDRQLLVCTYSGFAGIWDIRSGKLVQKLKYSEYYSCKDASFINEGTQVLIIPDSGDKTFLLVYDVQTGIKIKEIVQNQRMTKACQSFDGKMLYVAYRKKIDQIGWSETGWMYGVDIWNICDWTKTRTLDFEIDDRSNICISPGGTVLAVSDESGTVLRSLPEGEVLWKFGHLISADANNIAFSHDQSTLCVGANGFVYVYSLRWRLLPPG